jgi:hypothetical protein
LTFGVICMARLLRFDGSAMAPPETGSRVVRRLAN